ncbi:tripartite motif-containing protein 16-like protein [Triplophysa rosa]|uniref:tripartite motif-containing protein 16-like protein n=1 Tax=Triplophysa rosa TaxID=992332 RepID=UPI0025461D7A|nr:tripartite motif-containing protein 16-like protein [Triplophysa rosa]
MAEACFSAEQFSCPVCLDLLSDPVAIPCGHSYCMSCITDCWNHEDLKGIYSCPQCRQTFTPRPALGKNTMLADVVEKLKKTKLRSDVHALCFAGPGDVEWIVICLHQRNIKETQRVIQDRIQQRQKHLQKLREAVKSHKLSAQTAVEDSKRIFTELIRYIERSCFKLTQLIRDQEKTAVSRAEGVLKRLEQEINDLKRRETELEQLSYTDNDIHFLQSFQSLSPPPEPTESTIVSFLCSFDGVRESVCQLRQKLQDFCQEQITKISNHNIVPKIREEFLQYSCQLTLDPNTVNKNLSLSERNRKITFTGTVQQYPDHPDRFDNFFQVLCRESVFGRCYWELEWSGGDFSFVFISVSYKNISRKGGGDECGFGCNDHSWGLYCSSSSYSFWHNNKQTIIPVKCRSSRVGVYVDHSTGTLSFYGISDKMSLIHRV